MSDAFEDGNEVLRRKVERVSEKDASRNDATGVNDLTN